MELKNIYKRYDNELILDNINIGFDEGEIFSLLGPSGCGKTTLLNIMAGLRGFEKGKIEGFNNKTISYVFQEPRLLKHLTVYENIELVLKDKEIEKDTIKNLIYNYLEETGLIDYKNYLPNELSGGMKQRVSLVRAFVYPSDIILMDEPFQALDLSLKLNLISFFKSLWEKHRKTIIFVTHDITSSVLLGDKICILSNKPTKVKKIFDNTIYYNNREAFSDEVLKLEKEIANILLS